MNQSKEERTKFYEARRAQKGQEVIETRNDKANSSGGQARKGSGANEKEILPDKRILKAKHRRRLLPTKKFPLVRNVGRHIEVNVDRGQMFAIFMAKRDIMQRTAIRNGIQKTEQIFQVIKVSNNSTQFRLRWKTIQLDRVYWEEMSPQHESSPLSKVMLKRDNQMWLQVSS